MHNIGLRHRHVSRRAFLGQVGSGAALLASGGCSPSAGTKTNGPVSVVLVVLDTVRAQSCGAWGHKRNTTPHLDKLASQSTRYNMAISPAPWTLPAHVGLFTGNYTMEHGVRGYIYTDDAGQRRIRENALPDDAVTVAEQLYHRGYGTASFSANTGYMAPYFNLSQGFETYHLEQIPGVDLAKKALGWVADTEGPSFLFCNFMDAHRPYNLSPCPETLPGDVSEDLTLLDTLREKTLAHPELVDQTLADRVTGQYELGVANADRALGTLIAGLKAQGRFEDTLLIVCADHGEYLGEHGLVEHSKDVYQEAVHVPLVVKAPRQAIGTRVDWPVSLTQVPSTIYTHAGLPLAAGLPPLDIQDETFPVISENYYSRDWDYTDSRWPGRFDRIRTAYYAYPWKYIHSSDGADELFDLSVDPDEQRNCRETEVATYRRLRNRCEALLATRRRPREAGALDGESLPDAAIEELRTLGYL